MHWSEELSERELGALAGLAIYRRLSSIPEPQRGEVLRYLRHAESPYSEKAIIDALSTQDMRDWADALIDRMPDEILDFGQALLEKIGVEANIRRLEYEVPGASEGSA